MNVALPKIVKETKKETKEMKPPEEIEFTYLPGKTGKAEIKEYLKKFL